MATTLAQYKYLGPAADIRAGIAQYIYTESEFLRVLPFTQLQNNNITRTKFELEAAGADVYEVNETWQQSEAKFEYRDHNLCIIGGDADVDNFGQLAAGGEDVMASQIMLKTKDLQQTFEKLAIVGQTTAEATYSATKNMKGLLRLLCEVETASANTGATDLDGGIYNAHSGANNPQVLAAASGASATITLDMLDWLIAAVTNCEAIMTNFQMIQKITSLARAAGNNLSHDNDELGKIVTRYGDVRVIRNDFVPVNFPDPSTYVFAPASYTITTAVAAGNDTCPIFAFRMGEDALTGINGEGMIQVEKFDKLETKDGKRTRIKWYAGLSLRNKRALAGLFGATVT